VGQENVQLIAQVGPGDTMAAPIRVGLLLAVLVMSAILRPLITTLINPR